MSNAIFSWSEEKNAILKAERNISFEEILIALESGNLVEIIPNPSQNHRGFGIRSQLASTAEFFGRDALERPQRNS